MITFPEQWVFEAPDHQQHRRYERTGTAEGSMESPPAIVVFYNYWEQLSCGLTAEIVKPPSWRHVGRGP
jgi:hypothetical protein